MRYNSIHTVQHLYIAKLYLIGERPEPFKSIHPLFLYIRPLKPDSAPVQGDGYKPASFRIQQSQRRDIRTAAQRRRCDVVVVQKIFLLGGWAPAEGYKHNYYVFIYMLSTLKLWHSNIAATPFFLYSIIVYILYSTYTQLNCTL